VFLIRSAERSRQGALRAVGWTVFLGLVLFPSPSVETIVGNVVAPVAIPVAYVGAWAFQWLHPNPLISQDKDVERLAQLPSVSLAEEEQKTGYPDPVSGLAWLEVPVVETDLERGRLWLAAGKDFALASGQAVVFGNYWVGRIGKVFEQRAEVELWIAPGARTGVELLRQGSSVSGVCLGRGQKALPLIRWIQPTGHPASGDRILWRASEEDPPALAKKKYLLGVLLRGGDESRGAGEWSADVALPLAVEGRVWVGAGAIGDSTVAEPSVRHAKCLPVLRGDAVLLGPWQSMIQEEPQFASALIWNGFALGAIKAQRSRYLWALGLTQEDWAEQGFPMRSSVTGFVSSFTRGGDGVPRGLQLGFSLPCSLEVLSGAETVHQSVEGEKE
jgi:hypothetical protein